jgi:hypothetical protein
MSAKEGLAGSLLPLCILMQIAANDRVHRPKPKPPPADVPLTVFSRSPDDATLALAINGLKSGYARVGDGERHFGICWQGGAGPFAVVLHGPDGRVLVQEAGIEASSNELFKMSAPVSFAEGVYTVIVTDGVGTNATGTFQVINRAALPAAAADGAPVTALRDLARADPTFAYEAYLATLPEAYRHPKSEAARLVSALCHRPGG